ncbi:MAG TPA: hypothetical protein VFK59_11570 [Actinomycetota bacterium]|nr:hypothetical protein [Actinomycetota bacterium]
MITRWLIRLELARDDDGPLGDEVTRELTRRLTEDGAQPVLDRGDAGAVLVQMTVDANSDRAARAAAESMLRDRAYEVWAALGLPPFTITFVEAEREGGPRP